MPYNRLTKPPLGTRTNKARAHQLRVIGWWLSNEGGGTTLGDASGNNRNATITTGASDSWQSAKFGSGYYYNNTGYATIANPMALTAGGHTRLCWYKADAVGSDGLVGNIGAANGDMSLRVVGDAGGMINVFVNAGIDGSASTPISVNTWYCFVGVYRPSGVCEIWVDGVLKASDTPSANTSIVGPEQIGTDFDQTRLADGIIDHCAACARDLSPFEIVRLYHDPFWVFGRERIELWSYTAPAGIPIFRRRRAG